MWFWTFTTKHVTLVFMQKKKRLKKFSIKDLSFMPGFHIQLSGHLSTETEWSYCSGRSSSSLGPWLHESHSLPLPHPQRGGLRSAAAVLGWCYSLPGSGSAKPLGSFQPCPAWSEWETEPAQLRGQTKCRDVHIRHMFCIFVPQRFTSKVLFMKFYHCSNYISLWVHQKLPYKTRRQLK